MSGNPNESPRSLPRLAVTAGSPLLNPVASSVTGAAGAPGTTSSSGAGPAGPVGPAGSAHPASASGAGSAAAGATNGNNGVSNNPAGLGSILNWSQPALVAKIGSSTPPSIAATPKSTSPASIASIASLPSVTGHPPLKSESPPVTTGTSSTVAAPRSRRGSTHARTKPPLSKPKARAMSGTGQASSRAQVAASLARRRHSSGTPQPPMFSSNKIDVPPTADGKPLNTHSPLAIAAAAAVTPEKIRRLLLSQGPLAIRHITAHLILTIPGFGNLSLSKQRRLIIAVLDNGDPEKGFQFVKVGWGRWAVDNGDGPSTTPQLSAAASSGLGRASHRESISRRLPNNKPPLSPGLQAVGDDELAILSDSEDDDDVAGVARLRSRTHSRIRHDDDSDDDLALTSSSEPEEGTDEEDWQSLRPGQALPRQTSSREQDAIAALVQLADPRSMQA